MSMVSKLLSAIRGGVEPKPTAAPAEAAKPAYAIPTVKFDSKKVTETVKSDLRKNIESISEFDGCEFDQIYDAALRSISRGRDVGSLCNTIMQMNINGMTKNRAGEIAISLNEKATALINREKQISLGIKYALWVYSGAPCQTTTYKPSPKDIRQDAAHKAANGKRYEVVKGMFLDGKWTWPGREDGCKCVSRSIIPGFVR